MYALWLSTQLEWVRHICRVKHLRYGTRLIEKWIYRATEKHMDETISPGRQMASMPEVVTHTQLEEAFQVHMAHVTRKTWSADCLVQQTDYMAASIGRLPAAYRDVLPSSGMNNIKRCAKRRKRKWDANPFSCIILTSILPSHWNSRSSTYFIVL